MSVLFHLARVLEFKNIPITLKHLAFLSKLFLLYLFVWMECLPFVNELNTPSGRETITIGKYIAPCCMENNAKISPRKHFNVSRETFVQPINTFILFFPHTI